MLNPALALKAALRARLMAQTQFVALLGGSFVFDSPPHAQAMPYVVFSAERSRDFSTSTESGTEHVFEISVFSTYEGTQEALTIAQSLIENLHDAPLTLTDHTLVNLRHIESQTSRIFEPEPHIKLATKWRAVTEPTP